MFIKRYLFLFPLILLIACGASVTARPPANNTIPIANPDDLVRADPWIETTSGGESLGNNHQIIVINTGLFFLDYSISTLKILSINPKSRTTDNLKTCMSKNNATKR